MQKQAERSCQEGTCEYEVKLGHKTTWERLKTQYDHEKSVIAVHMDEIIILHQVKGTNYDQVREFYERIRRIANLGTGGHATRSRYVNYEQTS